MNETNEEAKNGGEDPGKTIAIEWKNGRGKMI